MEGHNNQEQAKKVFDTLCRTMDKQSWPYKKEDGELTIRCKVSGDDLPMDVVIEVDEKRAIIRLFSPMPFVVCEDKRLDVAVAISVINNKLANGCFDYDLSDGTIFFRITNSFLGSEIGEELLLYLCKAGFAIIDEYNDKLMMLATGMLSIEKFLEMAMN